MAPGLRHRLVKAVSETDPMTLNGVERSTSPADWPRVHPLFASWLDGGWRTFALLMCFGAAALVFAFATVFYGRDLAAQSGPSGCRTIIAYWQQHGYIHTGGLIHLPAPWRASGSREIFWRSSTGAYLATG